MKNELRLGYSMSDDVDSDSVVDDEVIAQQIEEEVEVEVVLEEEPVDPLTEALDRAEKAEKEILYRDAEIQNVRKRMLAEKSAALTYGTLPLARRMLTILADIDRALAVNEDDFLKMIRAKLWTELSSDGVSEIEAKGLVFDPVKMEAVTMIPSSDEYPPHIVVEVLEAGFTFKERVIFPSKVVVASE